MPGEQRGEAEGPAAPSTRSEVLRLPPGQPPPSPGLTLPGQGLRAEPQRLAPVLSRCQGLLLGQS